MEKEALGMLYELVTQVEGFPNSAQKCKYKIWSIRFMEMAEELEQLERRRNIKNELYVYR